MTLPDKMDMVPETLRKEMSDFVSKNANFLFGAVNSLDEGTMKLNSIYEEMAKQYRELADIYQNQFLDLLVAETFDKVAAAKLIQELFRLIADQNRGIENSRQTLFKEYRFMYNVVTIYLAFVSSEGIDVKEIMEG